MNTLLPNYEHWKAINSPSFNLYDYIHGIFLKNEASPDLGFAFLKLIWPDFIEVSGFVFLKENYRGDKIDALKETVRSDDELEFWINLTSLESIFPESYEQLARLITDELVAAWQCKLKSDFPDKTFFVRCIEDDGEKHITFSQKGN